MGKTIFFRCLALLGMAACAYAMVATYSVLRHNHDVQVRLAQWCTSRTDCVGVRLEASLNKPVLKVHMKRARVPYKSEVLLADMRRAGVFAASEDQTLPSLKLPSTNFLLTVIPG